MKVRFEKEGRIRRIVIEFEAKRVIVEGDIPEPLLDIPLDNKIVEALKKWLSARAEVKELKDE